MQAVTVFTLHIRIHAFPKDINKFGKSMNPAPPHKPWTNYKAADDWESVQIYFLLKLQQYHLI